MFRLAHVLGVGQVVGHIEAHVWEGAHVLHPAPW